MKKCKLCGGACLSIGNGQYQCDCCGNFFSEYDFMSVKEKSEFDAAKVRAVEEARIKTEAANEGADLFDKSKDGVLEINCRGKRSAWSGSGYIVSYKGYAITNAHVAADEDGRPCLNIVVKVNGYSIKANVIALGDNKSGNGNGVDLAIIQLEKMPSGLKALPLGDFSAVRTGEQIYVIGNSLGYGTCITSGIVSDKNRNGLLMYDCATNPGNSGGPVFNAKGEIIGTHVAGQSANNGTKAQGMNYAIPVSMVKLLIEKSGIIL